MKKAPAKTSKPAGDEGFVTVAVLNDLKLDDKHTLKVSHVRIGGEDKIDVRVHLHTDKYTGPSRQGMLIAQKDFEKFADMIADSLEQAKEAGFTKAPKTAAKKVAKK